MAKTDIGPMKAARIHKYGAPEVLQIDEIDRPVPSPSQVLVEVHAAAVNPIDWKIRSGGQRGIIRYKLPHVLGLDVSGVVIEVGSQVVRFKPGDEVYASPSHQAQGTYAEYVAIDETAVALKPNNLDHQEAAGIPLAGLTAWEALVVFGRLSENDKVLIQAGSGGVGTLAIQLAKQIGAKVATTCSRRNTELVRELGADYVIDYTIEQFDDVLSNYDLVLDAVGGKAKARALKVLRRGGRLASIVTGLPEYTARYGPILGAGLALSRAMSFVLTTKIKHGIRVSNVFRRSDGHKLAELTKLLEKGKIRPVVDRVFPLEEIVEAHRYSQTGRARGKIIISVKSIL